MNIANPHMMFAIAGTLNVDPMHSHVESLAPFQTHVLASEPDQEYGAAVVKSVMRTNAFQTSCLDAASNDVILHMDVKTPLESVNNVIAK